MSSSQDNQSPCKTCGGTGKDDWDVMNQRHYTCSTCKDTGTQSTQQDRHDIGTAQTPDDKPFENVSQLSAKPAGPKSWGWKVMYSRAERNGLTIYMGKRFISFHFPLHNGWQSHPKFWWNKGGWEYYEPAILLGHWRNDSHWINLGHWLVPAKLDQLWKMRRKAYRDAFKKVAQESDNNPETLLNQQSDGDTTVPMSVKELQNGQ